MKRERFSPSGTMKTDTAADTLEKLHLPECAHTKRFVKGQSRTRPLWSHVPARGRVCYYRVSETPSTSTMLPSLENTSHSTGIMQTQQACQAGHLGAVAGLLYGACLPCPSVVPHSSGSNLALLVQVHCWTAAGASHLQTLCFVGFVVPAGPS